jgi:hypothetical protein
VSDPSQLFTCGSAGVKIGFGFDGSILHLEHDGVSNKMFHVSLMVRIRNELVQYTWLRKKFIAKYAKSSF